LEVEIPTVWLEQFFARHDFSANYNLFQLFHASNEDNSNELLTKRNDLAV